MRLADSEIRTAKPEHRERDRYRHQARERPREQQGEIDIHVERAGQIEQGIATEADIGLLADRDQAGIAGEQVPELRERNIVGHLADEPHPSRIAPPR
jgi:hypothetical protein